MGLVERCINVGSSTVWPVMAVLSVFFEDLALPVSGVRPGAELCVRAIGSDLCITGHIVLQKKKRLDGEVTNRIGRKPKMAVSAAETQGDKDIS